MEHFHAVVTSRWNARLGRQVFVGQVRQAQT
jgi:hypothetical protein